MTTECKHCKDTCAWGACVRQENELTVTLPDRAMTYTKVFGFDNGVWTVTHANGPVDIHWEGEGDA